MADIFAPSVWLIPCYALMGSVLSSLWFPGITRRTGPRPSGYVNILFTAIAFLHGLAALVEIWGKPSMTFSSLWLNATSLQINLDWQVSALTLGAIVLVTGLNLLSQIYAIGYLEMDWGWARFYAVVGLFEAGMTALVLCDSLFFAYFILEILTLCTYLLVGLWFNQPLVVTGARDAFLTKRVGDLILLMGVVALLPLAGTWNFEGLAAWSNRVQAGEIAADPTQLTLVCLALMAGPLGKCAQFPLHLWLDEAQEGPLPATILRNSVVVATGALVLIRLQTLFELAPFAQQTMVAVGAVTAIGAVLVAIAQIDVKRALSYLVSAYMGLVFIAVGTEQTQAAYLLLLTYAVAMALLVMSIGTVVLSNVTQNLTQLGGLWSRRPLPGIAFLVGAISLVALPPFGGFWSMVSLATGLWDNGAGLDIFAVLLAVNGLTAFSLMRVFGLIWGGKPTQMTVRSAEVLWPLILPMMGLMGIVLHVPIVLSALDLLPSWVEVNVPIGLSLTGSTILGAGLGAWVYIGNSIAKPIRLPVPALQDFFAYDLYTQQLYKVTIVAFVGFISFLVSSVDRYVIDGFVNLVGLATMGSGEGLKYNSTGQTQFYALTIVVTISLLGALIIWPIL
jgi:NAD(P)H-quinone oxidoreductase subunit 5